MYLMIRHKHLAQQLKSFPPLGKRCDVLLVDGPHSALRVKYDLLSLRTASARDNRAVVDDTNIGAGKAVQFLHRVKALEVLESYGVFPKFSQHNPTKWQWGYAVVRLNASDTRVAGRLGRAELGADEVPGKLE